MPKPFESKLTPTQFEAVLTRAAEILTENLRASDLYHGPAQLNQGTIDMLKVAAEGCGVVVEPTFHPNAFPDIKVNGYGVEAKYSKRDTWNSVANSIFEGMRDPTVGRLRKSYFPDHSRHMADLTEGGYVLASSTTPSSCGEMACWP